jgi:hypothetical protein
MRGRKKALGVLYLSVGQRPNPENPTSKPWMTHFKILNNVLLCKYTTLGSPSGIAFLTPHSGIVVLGSCGGITTEGSVERCAPHGSDFDPSTAHQQPECYRPVSTTLLPCLHDSSLLLHPVATYRSGELLVLKVHETVLYLVGWEELRQTLNSRKIRSGPKVY